MNFVLADDYAFYYMLDILLLNSFVLGVSKLLSQGKREIGTKSS